MQTLIAEAIHTPNFVPAVTIEPSQIAQRAIDVASGLLLTHIQLAGRLGISGSALSQACKMNRLFSIPGADGIALYPAFFAHRNQNRRTLEAVTRALGDLSGQRKWDFFTTAQPFLNSRKPLDVLADGNDLDIVLAAAHMFKEQ